MALSEERFGLRSPAEAKKKNSIIDIAARVAALVRIATLAMLPLGFMAHKIFEVFMHFSSVFIMALFYGVEGKTAIAYFYFFLLILSIFFGICTLLFAVLPGKRRFLLYAFIGDLIFDIICIVWSMIVGSFDIAKVFAVIFALLSLVLAFVKLSLDKKAERKTGDGTSSL